MAIRPFLYAFTLLSACLTLLAEKPTAPLNVVFIVADDMNVDEVGAYGGKTLTPRLDSLVTEGRGFSQSYVSSPVCSPSRYSTLTGRYASRCTHPDYFKISPPGAISRPSNKSMTLERDRPNLMKTLQANGYTTGIVGKWHLGNWMAGWQVDGEWRFPPGFYEMGLQDYAYDASFDDPAFLAKLEHNQQVFREHLKEAGWDEAEAIYWCNPREQHHEELYNHNQEWLTHAAVEFIKEHKDEPFFLYLAVTIPHVPEPIDTLKNGDDPRLTGAGVSTGHLGVQPPRAGIMDRVAAAGKDVNTAHFTWLDDGIGTILKALQDEGLEDNTVVIFTSDHALSGKASLYENGVRVPLIIKGPGIAPGTSAELVQNIDLMPTILELTQSQPVPGTIFDGRSLMPLLDGEPAPWRDDLYMEYGYARAIRHGDWKYIAVRFPAEAVAAYREGRADSLPTLGANRSLGKWQARQRPDTYYTADQLYYLPDDPDERNNLAADLRYGDVLVDMKQRLKRYLATFPDRPYGELHEVASPPS